MLKLIADNYVDLLSVEDDRDMWSMPLPTLRNCSVGLRTSFVAFHFARCSMLTMPNR